MLELRPALRRPPELYWEQQISDSGKVVLFRATKPYWLVDASLGTETGLSVCSGDASNEWYLRVEPEHLDRLLFALRARKEHLGVADATMAYGDPVPANEILRLLFEAFGKASSNPYSDIKEFFVESEIRFSSDFWGSM